MKNYNIYPHWRGAGIERYEGVNRRDTRRVRTKIYNFLRKRASIKMNGKYGCTDKPMEYLPYGLCNSWITAEGYTITPMWIRPVPLTCWPDFFALFVHEGTHLLGWYLCFTENNFYGTRERFTLPSGHCVFVEWCSRDCIPFCGRWEFYRPYEEPTKDLHEFDLWRSANCPGRVAEKMLHDARSDWHNYVGKIGGARIAYEKGARIIETEVIHATARRWQNSSLISRGQKSAAFNKRQLRALGFVA